ADRTVRDLRSMLELTQKEIAIVKCVASRGEGIGELWIEIDSHYQLLKGGPGLLQRERDRARTELVEVLRERLLKVALERLSQQGAQLDDLALRIARRETDPWTVADQAARL